MFPFLVVVVVMFPSVLLYHSNVFYRLPCLPLGSYYKENIPSLASILHSFSLHPSISAAAANSSGCFVKNRLVADPADPSARVQSK